MKLGRVLGDVGEITYSGLWLVAASQFHGNDGVYPLQWLLKITSIHRCTIAHDLAIVTPPWKKNSVQFSFSKLLVLHLDMFHCTNITGQRNAMRVQGAFGIAQGADGIGHDVTSLSTCTWNRSRHSPPTSWSSKELISMIRRRSPIKWLKASAYFQQLQKFWF